MTGNENIIHTFYKAFQLKDFKTMQSCYADHAIFSDSVFVDLGAQQVKSMWAFLCLRGKDLQVAYSHVVAGEREGSAEWVATYTFSATNKKVINRIKANFIFENGKIIAHRDVFHFYRWARQAFGIKGWLLGWTSFFKNKVRKQALKNLEFYQSNL